MTVEYMLNTMSDEELTYWKAWTALENEDMEAERAKTENVRKVSGARRR
jgi:hypothetical protein